MSCGSAKQSKKMERSRPDSETEVPGLFVLTVERSRLLSTNLLYGSYMPELLKQLRAEFETILIDTPPMLQIPDARVMGRIAIASSWWCGRARRAGMRQ